MSQTITEFLEARIAEDERLSENALGLLGQETDWWTWNHLKLRFPDLSRSDAMHIAQASPRRVLAECAAKRAILAECRPSTLDDLDCGEDDQPAPMWVARTLAAVYKDHPDYQQEWAA